MLCRDEHERYGCTGWSSTPSASTVVTALRNRQSVARRSGHVDRFDSRYRIGPTAYGQACRPFFEQACLGQKPLEHIIPHQTSQLTMNAGIREMRGYLNEDYSDRLINNLRLRGNTSSTVSFRRVCTTPSKKEKSTRTSRSSFAYPAPGNRSVPPFTNSTIFHRECEIRKAVEETRADSAQSEIEINTWPITLAIRGIGFAYPVSESEPDSADMMAAAVDNCLADSTLPKRDRFARRRLHLSQRVHHGTGMAALVAGRSKLNEDQAADDPEKIFAFDIMNGDVGFLKSVYLGRRV